MLREICAVVMMLSATTSFAADKNLYPMPAANTLTPTLARKSQNCIRLVGDSDAEGAVEGERNEKASTRRRIVAGDQSGDGKRCRTWQVKFERSTKYPAVSGLIVPLAKFAI
jgi:hypothetical protein